MNFFKSGYYSYPTLCACPHWSCMYWISCFHNKKAFSAYQWMDWIRKHDAHSSQFTSQCLQHLFQMEYCMSFTFGSKDLLCILFSRKSWRRHTFDGKNIFHLYVILQWKQLTNAVSLDADHDVIIPTLHKYIQTSASFSL